MTAFNTHTSAFIKSAAGLTFLAFVLLILGYATPLWSTSLGNDLGLWEICSGGNCKASVNEPIGDESWYIAVQSMITIGLIVGFAGVVVTFIIIFGAGCGQSRFMRIAALVFSFVTAALLLIGVIVYWVEGKMDFYPDFDLNFSWGITVASTVVYVIAGILLAIELDHFDKEAARREEEEEARKEGEEKDTEKEPEKEKETV